MKKNTIKNAIFLLLLIASFTISTFTTMTISSKAVLNDSASLGEAPRTAAGSGTLPNGAEYNWSEDTYKATVIEIFNNDNEEKNTTSTSERTYSGEKSYLYWNETFNQWNEDEFTITINTNYTFWYNLTHSGNYTLKADLDIYSVNLTYGNNLELLWMALKNGTYIREYWTTYYNFNTTQSCQYMINKTFIARKVYNAINIGGVWKKGSLNHTYVPANEITSGEYNYAWSEEIKTPELSRFETTLTAPQIYIMQTYTTEDGETVAWVNRIDNQFFIYNDSDENMIFSAGNIKGYTDNFPYMYMADEYVGIMEVGAQDVKVGTYHQISPRDVSIEKLVSNITFSSPIETGDNKISWNITYNEYPVSATIWDGPGFMTTSNPIYDNGYATYKNATYNNMSPMNFSYQFEYEVLPQRADLDYTFGMSKITNSSFYMKTQGYGLAIPYHSYFMASNEVEQTTNNDLNFAEASIDFVLGDEQVGMIDMNNPLKINYTLYNYTGTGDDDVFKSIGSTVNEQTTEIEKNLDRNFMIFTLANLTRQREPLENFVDSFEIELMNYPMWSGEQLTHDPTFTALWGTKSKSTLPVPDGNDDDDNSRNGASIPFGNFYLFFIVVGIIGVVIYRRRKLKIN